MQASRTESTFFKTCPKVLTITLWCPSVQEGSDISHQNVQVYQRAHNTESTLRTSSPRKKKTHLFSTERRSILRVLTYAGAIMAFLIGSGFATGQEIMQYYAAYGFCGQIGRASSAER